MPLSVVVGGQYGSEGKGKLVAHLAQTAGAEVAVVRCGGPNSGHTIDVDGKPYPLRQLPSGARTGSSRLYLSAGMIVDPTILFREMNDLGVDECRVRVDRNAVVVDQQDLDSEGAAQLQQRIGSTHSGTGSAVARRALRDPSQCRAGEHDHLGRMATNVSRALNQHLDDGFSVIVEGTQGSALSLLHSDHVPFVTSRDTNAAGFLSEVGLAPTLVTDVYLILRTFPIRVAGNSGPLPGEISWANLTEGCGSPEPIIESTTVTGKTRRVARFDWDKAEDAVRLNRPTKLAVHGLDYLDICNRQATDWSRLSVKARRFISELERRLHVSVEILFTGPRTCDVLDMRAQQASEQKDRVVRVPA